MSDREGTGGQPFCCVPSTNAEFLIIIISGSQVAHSFISYIHIHLLGVYSVHRIVLTPSEREENCKYLLSI